MGQNRDLFLYIDRLRVKTVDKIIKTLGIILGRKMDKLEIRDDYALDADLRWRIVKTIDAGWVA